MLVMVLAAIVAIVSVMTVAAVMAIMTVVLAMVVIMVVVMVVVVAVMVVLLMVVLVVLLVVVPGAVRRERSIGREGSVRREATVGREGSVRRISGETRRSRRSGRARRESWGDARSGDGDGDGDRDSDRDSLNNGRLSDDLGLNSSHGGGRDDDGLGSGLPLPLGVPLGLGLDARGRAAVVPTARGEAGSLRGVGTIGGEATAGRSWREGEVVVMVMVMVMIVVVIMVVIMVMVMVVVVVPRLGSSESSGRKGQRKHVLVMHDEYSVLVPIVSGSQDILGKKSHFYSSSTPISLYTIASSILASSS